MINKFLKDNKTLTLFDQIIVSGSNFLSSILILRYLGIEEFGIFSFFWLVILFIYSIQQSLIISPLFSNSPKYKNSNLNIFYGNIFIQQIILIILTLIIFLIFIKLFEIIKSEYNFADYFLEISFLIITSQFYNFFRRLHYSKGLQLNIFFIDMIIYITFFIILNYYNHNNSLNLLIILKLFSFIFFLGTLLSYKLYKEFKFEKKLFFIIINENWSISSWLVFSNIIQWFSANLWLINIGLILGPFYLGVIRACQTILNVSNLLFQAMENIYAQKISLIFQNDGKDKMRKYIFKLNYKGLFFTVLLSFLIFFTSEILLVTFYGKDLSKFNHILSILAFMIPLNFLNYLVPYGLRALGKTFPIFLSYLITSMIALLFSGLIIERYQINGFLVGVYLTQVLILVITIGSYQYIIKKK